jgi:hypothetical protein
MSLCVDDIIWSAATTTFLATLLVASKLLIWNFDLSLARLLPFKHAGSTSWYPLRVDKYAGRSPSCCQLSDLCKWRMAQSVVPREQLGGLRSGVLYLLVLRDRIVTIFFQIE